MDTTDEKDQKIIELENRLVELENNWKRALADYKNLEKRTQEEKKNLVEFSNSVLIEKLLPVLDTFEMIEKHTTDMGIQISVKEFRQILESTGLTELVTKVGQEFSHENMDAIETKTGEKNKILEIVRKGYLYKEKLIRPVSVKVGNGEKVEADAEKETNNE